MSEQNWEIVLSYLYNHESKIAYRDNEIPSRKFDIIQTTGLSPVELENTLEHMVNIGLAEKKRESREDASDAGGTATKMFVEYSLSKRGFAVSHERELTTKHHKTLEKSANLSAFLVLAIAAQSLINLAHSEGSWETGVVGVIVLLIVFGVLFELNRESIESRLGW